MEWYLNKHRNNFSFTKISGGAVNHITLPLQHGSVTCNHTKMLFNDFSQVRWKIPYYINIQTWNKNVALRVLDSPIYTTSILLKLRKIICGVEAVHFTHTREQNGNTVSKVYIHENCSLPQFHHKQRFTTDAYKPSDTVLWLDPRTCSFCIYLTTITVHYH